MIYYIIAAYTLATLWFSTHCSDCYFSKTHYIVIEEHNHSLPIIKPMPKPITNTKKYYDTCPVVL